MVPLSALSNASLLRIVVLLSVSDELCVCDLSAALELAQPRILRELPLLREAGLVVDRRAGQWVHYRIDPALSEWVRELLRVLVHGISGQSPYNDDARRLAVIGRTQGCD